MCVRAPKRGHVVSINSYVWRKVNYILCERIDLIENFRAQSVILCMCVRAARDTVIWRGWHLDAAEPFAGRFHFCPSRKSTPTTHDTQLSCTMAMAAQTRIGKSELTSSAYAFRHWAGCCRCKCSHTLDCLSI